MYTYIYIYICTDVWHECRQHNKHQVRRHCFLFLQAALMRLCSMLRCVVAWDRADCRWFMKQTGLKHVLKSFKRLMLSPSFQTNHMFVHCMTSFAILVSPRAIVGTGSTRGGPYRNSPRRAHSGTFTISPTTAKTPPPLTMWGALFYFKK